MSFYIKKEDGSFEEAKAFSEAEVQAKLRERVDRINEKYADYETLKTDLASKTKDFEAAEAAKSKLEAELADATSKIKSSELEALRTKIRAKHGIDEKLSQFLTAEDEAGLTEQAELLKGNQQETGSKKLVINKDTGSGPAEDSVRKATKDIFGKE